MDTAKAYLTALNAIRLKQECHYENIHEQIAVLDPEDASGYKAPKALAIEIHKLKYKLNTEIRAKNFTSTLK